MKEIIFGNPDKFAIRYIPGYKTEYDSYYYAYLHLILGGQLIGDPKEECFLLTWLNAVKRINREIINSPKILSNEEFENSPDNEILDSAYNFTIDETTDGWLIALTESEGYLRFIWKGWRNPCPKDRIGKIYSTKIKRENMLGSINESG